MGGKREKEWGRAMVAEELWAKVERYSKVASYKLFRCAEEAEDFQQDAAVLCMSFPQRYNGLSDTSVELLAHRAIWNMGLDKIRHRQVEEKAYRSKIGDSLCSPGDQGSIEAMEILHMLENGLVGKDLDVYRLYAKGNRPQEIADILGRSYGAVQSSLHRVRETARRFLVEK
jgi:DNA-directed RNA polymerase specialized sigma24 family protein